MSRRIYAYLRASTKEQDASRARPEILKFADDHGETIAGWFIENASGASLKRPKLFEMIELMMPNDIILIESIDRITRLTQKDWDKLKAILYTKQIKIIALDMPTTFTFFDNGDEFTQRIHAGFNQMLIEFAAAMARKDYDLRRERQEQGIKNKIAKTGQYRKSKDTSKRDKEVLQMVSAGATDKRIQEFFNISRTTLWRIKKLSLENFV